MSRNHDESVQTIVRGFLYRLKLVQIFTLQKGERIEPLHDQRSGVVLIAIAGGRWEVQIKQQNIILQNGSVLVLPAHSPLSAAAYEVEFPLLAYRILLESYRLVEQTHASLVYQRLFGAGRIFK